MPSVSSSNSRSSRSEGFCQTCSRSLDKEWDKIEVAKQKLAIQQERMTLDQEMLKVERKNLKRSSKIAKNTAQSTAQSTSSWEKEVESLKGQLVEAQSALWKKGTEQQELQRRLEQQQAQTTNSHISKEQHEKELKDSQQHLSATQQSLAAMLVERDAARREREEFQAQLQQAREKLKEMESQPKRPVSMSSIVCTKCADFQVELQQVEDDLQTMKLAYANVQAKYAQEKREWKLSQDQHDQSNQGEVHKLQDMLEQMQLENEELQAETQLLREESKVVEADPNSAEWKKDRDELVKQIEALQAENIAYANAEAKFAQEKREFEIVQGQSESKQEKIERLQGTLERLREENTNLRTHTDLSASSPATQLKDAELQWNVERKVLQEQISKLQTVEMAYSGAQTQFDQEKRELTLSLEQQRASNQQEIVRLEEVLSQTRAENFALQGEMEGLRQTVATGQSAAATAAQLKGSEQDWNNERQILQKQLADQSRQLGDLQLLVPRNKMLLEQTQAKNKTLQAKMDEMQKQYDEQQELIQELQATKEALVKHQQKTGIDASVPSSDMGTNGTSASQPANADPSEVSISTLKAVIPSDLSTRPEKKHVVEWEWKSETGLYGVYTGWLDMTATPDGNGTLRVEDGAIYDGEWRHGLRHGHGVYNSYDGDLYRGMWNHDRFHGRGVYVWPDGQMYTGDYVNGIRQGKGIETWPHGARYEGEYAHDRRNGQGTYWYADGRCYSGEYKDDRPNGQGKQTAPDGSVLYDGEWTLGEFING